MREKAITASELEDLNGALPQDCAEKDAFEHVCVAKAYGGS
jgi:hypothetical protein